MWEGDERMKVLYHGWLGKQQNRFELEAVLFGELVRASALADWRPEATQDSQWRQLSSKPAKKESKTNKSVCNVISVVTMNKRNLLRLNFIFCITHYLDALTKPNKWRFSYLQLS